MDLIDFTVFGFTGWRIALAAALLLGYALYKIYTSRNELRQRDPAGVAGGSGLVYTEAPTVRLTDTQRIDRLHRLLTLSPGERADLRELTFGRLPQLRVTFVGVEHESGEDFAHLQIDLGGAEAGCGSEVKELKENHFLVPRAHPDEQRTSILYFCGKPDAVSFLQIKVPRIDAVKQTAAIDVLHIRGRWSES